MAAYITYESGQQRTWHIGTGKIEKVDAVGTIQADGDELNKIQDLFSSTIPQTGQRVQSWFGDTAKTIAFALSAG